jgi:hypothetical protein
MAIRTTEDTIGKPRADHGTLIAVAISAISDP